MRGFCQNLGVLADNNSFLVELTAVATAVELVMGLDLPHVVVESDSMEVVQGLTDPHAPSHLYAEIIQGVIRSRDAHGSMRFQHVYREGNALADYLAHVALASPPGVHQLEFPI